MFLRILQISWKDTETDGNSGKPVSPSSGGKAVLAGSFESKGFKLQSAG